MPRTAELRYRSRLKLLALRHHHQVRLLQLQLVVVFLSLGVCASAQTTASNLQDPASAPAPYRPITGKQRFGWFLLSTIGPTSLATGVFSAGISTAGNVPVEYGPHWEGFGKRYGMRLTGISTGNAMEAGLGSLWGEDPRYFRAQGRPFKGRVRNILVMTFAARHPDGNLAPAYARFIAIPGNNFLSNTWRADSVSNASHAGMRTLWGFLGRMGCNAFTEFWPDIRKKAFHKQGKE